MDTETTFLKLKSEKEYERKEALSHLTTVFDNLHEEDARNFVNQIVSIPKQNLEMQAQISRVLGCILPNIGGEAHISLLLESLKHYCETDDFDVREKAVLSIERLSAQVSKERITSDFVPLYSSMSQSDFYGLRCASSVLFCSSSKYFTKQEDILLAEKTLTTLSTDKQMEVRKSLSETFHECLQSNVFSLDFIKQTLNTISRDISPLVNSPVVQSLVLLDTQKENAFIQEIVTRIWSTNKFQNRCAVLEHIENLYLSDNLIASIYKDSFADGDYYVRKSAAKQLSFFNNKKVVDTATIENLAKDEDKSTRIELCKSLSQCGKDIPNTAAVLTILLNDKENDVKLHALETVAETGLAVDSAAEKLNELANSGLWRTKRDAASILPKIAATMDKALFNEKMFPILDNLLHNTANEVRNISVESSAKIAEYYGKEWYNEKIVPIINEFFNHKSYSYRQTAIHAAFASPDSSLFNEQLVKMSDDSCSNVRMVLAKEVPLSLTEIYNKLCEDKDEDVAYIAKKRTQ